MRVLKCNFPSTIILAEQFRLKFKVQLVCTFCSLFFFILLSKSLLHERIHVKDIADAGEHKVRIIYSQG